MNQRSAARGLLHKLTLRKLIGDPRIEESLLDDRVFTRFLYAQVCKSKFYFVMIYYRQNVTFILSGCVFTEKKHLKSCRISRNRRIWLKSFKNSFPSRKKFSLYDLVTYFRAMEWRTSESVGVTIQGLIQ